MKKLPCPWEVTYVCSGVLAGSAQAAVPSVLADVTPGDLFSAAEAGVSFVPHHCKERAEAWRSELEMNLSDKKRCCGKSPPLPIVETNLNSPSLPP